MNSNVKVYLSSRERVVVEVEEFMGSSLELATTDVTRMNEADLDWLLNVGGTSVTTVAPRALKECIVTAKYRRVFQMVYEGEAICVVFKPSRND